MSTCETQLTITVLIVNFTACPTFYCLPEQRRLRFTAIGEAGSRLLLARHINCLNVLDANKRLLFILFFSRLFLHVLLLRVSPSGRVIVFQGKGVG